MTYFDRTDIHPDLLRVLNKARALVTFSIIEGPRNKADQDKAHATGHSNATWGHSAHDFNPAFAVDVAPHPLDWKAINTFRVLASAIMGCAKDLGVDLTWGGDWKSIKDYDHFELTHWRTLCNDAPVLAATAPEKTSAPVLTHKLS